MIGWHCTALDAGRVSEGVWGDVHNYSRILLTRTYMRSARFPLVLYNVTILLPMHMN